MKNKNILHFLFEIIGKYKGKLFTFFCCEMFYFRIIPIFILPSILAIIGNKYQNKSLTTESILVLVLIYSLLFCLSSLMRAIFSEKIRYASIIKIEKDLRQKLFDYTIGHSTNFFNNTMSGVIASKVNNISKNFGDLCERAFSVISAFIMFIVTIFIYLKINIYLSLFLVIWTIILIFLQSRFSKKINKSIKLLTGEYNKVSGLITDNFTNIGNIKSFAKEKSEINGVRKQGFRILIKMSKVVSDQSAIQIILFFMLTSLMFVNIGFSLYLVLQKQMMIGTFLFVCQNVILLRGAITDLYNDSINLLMLWTEMKDGFDTLLQEYEIKDKDNPEILKAKNGKIVFKNVRFGYNFSKKE